MEWVLVVAFVVGVGVGFVPCFLMFLGVWKWLDRCQRERDGLRLRLANALLQLRTDSILEMVIDVEEGEADSEGEMG